MIDGQRFVTATGRGPLVVVLSGIWLSGIWLSGIWLVVSCSGGSSADVQASAKVKLPEMAGLTLVGRLGSRSSSTSKEKEQTPPAKDQPAGATWICLANFSDKAGECSGQWLDSKGALNPATKGTCAATNLSGQVTLGQVVSLSCDAGEGKTCLTKSGLATSDLMAFTLKSATQTDVTKSALAYLVGEKGEFIWAFESGTACNDAISKAKKSYETLQPKMTKVLDGSCSINDALTAVHSAAGTTRPGTPLHLAGGPGVPPRSACFDLQGVARTQCLINGSLAIEIHNVVNLADTEEVKRGERNPELCFLRAPTPTDSGKAPLHHIMRDTGSGGRVAYALRGSLTFENNGLRYSFQDFADVPNLPRLSTGLEMGVVTPEGDPDAASGVWKADLGRVLRFVPQQWCAKSYFNAEFRIETAGGEGTPQQGSLPPAPATEGRGASDKGSGGEGSGGEGSGGETTKTCD